jgi:murein DD-endopeptidase MepM/ murein hydrolase activator NlpD
VEADFGDQGWQWPLKHIEVTSPYGRRGREFHEGVDLRAKVGTPVYAAGNGVVLYAASRIRGYGRMVVIRHDSGLSTVYAHNSRLLVKQGQKVRQGQLVAYSGNTGHTRGPHLHFEVRNGLSPLNPLDMMPQLAFGDRPELKRVAQQQKQQQQQAGQVAQAPVPKKWWAKLVSEPDAHAGEK